VVGTAVTLKDCPRDLPFERVAHHQNSCGEFERL
jgi:hypothetical protein